MFLVLFQVKSNEISIMLLVEPTKESTEFIAEHELEKEAVESYPIENPIEIQNSQN